MTDTSKDAFNYQCECNLSYVSKSDLITVNLGHGHLKDMFYALSDERDALQSANEALMRERENIIETKRAQLVCYERVSIALGGDLEDANEKLTTARNDALDEAAGRVISEAQNTLNGVGIVEAETCANAILSLKKGGAE